MNAPAPRNSTSILSPAQTRGLGEIVLDHPPGTFAPTVASLTSIEAIGTHRELLHGPGIDWGCGVGALAIAAARHPDVTEVIGLDLSVRNVHAAFHNAHRNRVAGKTTFWQADSYAPASTGGRARLDALIGRTRFVLANPPASDGDDGFDFRRRVLRGAMRFLAHGAVVFLSISSQYGHRRIARLTDEIPGYRHGGVLSTTDWVPFDLKRADLLRCLESYAAEERRGGEAYEFVDPERLELGPTMTAEAALTCFRRTGLSPLVQWQTHLFRFEGALSQSSV